MTARRADRVADSVRAAVADLILRDLKDPRIGMVTITEVDMTDDLKHARVFFSVVGTEEERQRSLAGLESASGFIRREVGRRLQLRYAPQISFRLDASPERAQRVAELLHSTRDDEPEE
jgi:ribosome-binding factor A